jgi:uncharacterized protein (DUF2236 family)
VTAAPLRALSALAEPVREGLAECPLRVLSALAEPVRDSLGRDLRRVVGVRRDRRRFVSMDPEQAFLPPSAVARRVHADLPSMLVGGLSALLLQSLHPLTMAGVAEHSDYERDPVGRMRRTAAFVSATTYGTKEDAARAIRQVRRVHRGVRGVAPDGRPYSATDPELVTWVHVAEMWSFLQGAQRYGPFHFSPAECDAYFVETSVVARRLGAAWVPSSVGEVEAYVRRVRQDLYAGPQAMAARDFLLRGVAKRPEDRVVYTLLIAAAIGLLPGWARAELRLPTPPLLDRCAVAPLTRTMCAALRWAVTPPGPPPFSTDRQKSGDREPHHDREPAHDRPAGDRPERKEPAPHRGVPGQQGTGGRGAVS